MGVGTQILGSTLTAYSLLFSAAISWLPVSTGPHFRILALAGLNSAVPITLPGRKATSGSYRVLGLIT
jgi:hypothetical protein